MCNERTGFVYWFDNVVCVLFRICFIADVLFWVVFRNQYTTIVINIIIVSALECSFVGGRPSPRLAVRLQIGPDRMCFSLSLERCFRHDFFANRYLNVTRYYQRRVKTNQTKETREKLVTTLFNFCLNQVVFWDTKNRNNSFCNSDFCWNYIA